MYCQCGKPCIVPLPYPICGLYTCLYEYALANKLKINSPIVDFVMLLNSKQEEKQPNADVLKLCDKVQLEPGEKCQLYTEYRVKKAPNTNCTYLFHGSSIKNWYSIILNGLKSYSNTSKMKNGALYGAGIYLSDSLTLSYSYSALERGPTVVGVYEIENEKLYQKASSIFVVPEEHLIKLAYVIVIHKSHDLEEVGEILKKQFRTNAVVLYNNAKSFEKIRATRIMREMQQVAEFAEVEQCDDGWQVIYGEYIFLVQFPSNYPLDSVKIQVLTEQKSKFVGPNHYICLGITHDVQTRVLGLINVAVVALKQGGQNHPISSAMLDRTLDLVQLLT